MVPPLYRLARALLPAALGILMGAPLVEADVGAYSLRDLLRAARDASPEVRGARARLHAARARRRARNADERPDLSVQIQGRWTGRTFPAFFNVPPRTSEGTATLTHRLYSGGAREARRDAAFRRERAVAAEGRVATEGVLARVTGAYLEVLRELERAAVLEESLAARRRRLEETRARVDAGVLLETGALQGEIDVLDEERELRLARTREREARRVLRVLAGLGADDPVRLTGELDPFPAMSPREVRGVVDPETAPSMRQARSLRKAAGAEVAAARGERGLWVDVEGKMLKTFSGLGFGSADDFWQEVGGKAGITLLDGGRADAEVDAARARLRAARAGERSAEDDLRLASEEARDRLQEAEARLSQSLGRVALARRRHEISERRYLEGVALRTELLDADVAFRAARLEEVESRFDMLASMVRLLELSGALERRTLAAAESE